MMRLSYRYKLLLSVLALVVLLQAISYVATRTVIRDAVVENAYRELERGSELFSQLLDTRARQLSQAVSVLTDDFGFKEAVASADRPTIRSALLNHAARIEADIALVLNRQGQLVASSRDLAPEQYRVLTRLEEGAGRGDTRYAPVVIDDTLYQFVLSPIKAPLPIGTAGVGFAIDRDLSEHLKSLTDLEVSFLMLGDGGPRYLSGTLPPADREALLAQNERWNQPPGRPWEADQMLGASVSLASQPQRLRGVLQVPLERAMQPFDILDTQLVTLTVSFVFGAALIALLLARSVTRPVGQLASVARRIARGDYNSPVKARGHDELADLAGAFTSMQSAIAEREQEIRYQAEHDSLTDLANRAQVVPLMSEAMDHCREQGQSLLVLAADIHSFTRINDTLGPDVGDQVLRQVGARLSASFEGRSRVLRLGSDEFLLMLALEVGETAEAAATRVRDDFDTPLTLDDDDLNVDLNMGYAIYPEQGETVELLLRRAILALNHARDAFGNVFSYQPGWDEQHLRRMRLFGDFKPALEAGDICLYYQPKIDPNRPRQLGAEALIRWQHSELGFVNPEEFIAVIESAGQVNLLTRWVLRRALEDWCRFRQGRLELALSVNLSALDLLEDSLPPYIESLLSDYRVPASALCLEVTESAIMQDAERSLANLRRLHELGLRLSIDDYGTGYSSLSQLKQLPVDELKIDKSFVLELDRNRDDQQIVRSTIELGHTLGLKVIAEGVETADSRDWLVANGCDILQGYFYSKPAPPEAFADWARAYFSGES